MSAYYLVSVSNKRNLDLCLKYAMAGFTSSINGLWTFLEIERDDYISFLYGARVFNLYRVVRKVAYKNANNLPPWPSVTFKMSGKTYYFPFRLYLKEERILNEPMVRPEFAYVAENLLLRGGYRKTHFQGDTVTFYNISSMGTPSNRKNEQLKIVEEEFVPEIVFKRENASPPEKFYFRELILQSLIKRFLLSNRGGILNAILEYFKIKEPYYMFEVLGEKALPEGYVDIFIKNKHPKAFSEELVVEVKTGKIGKTDIEQLQSYIKELGSECKGGILVGKAFPKNVIEFHPENIQLIRHEFSNIDLNSFYTYEELFNILKLELII